MATVIAPGETSGASAFSTVAEWWPILLGLMIVFVPTYVWMASTLWVQEEYGHGPIIAIMIAWAVWRDRAAFSTEAKSPAPILGACLLVVGLLLFAIGRSQGFPAAEIFSQIPVLAGILLAFFGPRILRAFWFPLLFMLFMIPMPGSIVAAVTGPLKLEISHLVASALYLMGYPIAVDGVMLQIGPYQLLVADACSGLHSMFSLMALGVMYLYLFADAGFWRNALVVAFVWPIAFVSNAVRVLALVLITYYFGDEAGQGFLHGFAGILVFLFAVAGLLAVDKILSLVWPRPRQSTETAR